MDTLQKLMFLHRVKSASGGSVSWETISGTLPLTLLDAAAKPIKSLIRYGKVMQDGTPTPSSPVDIVCNNGVVRMVDDELPNGYKRLVGITFDGNLRYETGEALTGSDDVTMTLNNLSPSGKNVFGSYNGTNNVNFSLYIYGSTNGSYFRYGDQLKRPKYGDTGRRTITFGKSGTSGFADDSEVTPDEFTTPANTYIGMLPNSSSAAFTGDIVGSILVGNRLEWIPCEREDGVIGYYEKYNGNFLEPVGSGTPVSLGYDTSHLIVLTVVGTPEELTVGQFDTVSGSIASFVPDSTVPTVRGLTVNVEPVQDLHGYDNPWPAGGGKNLLDPNRIVEGKYIAANGTLLNGATNVAYEEFLLLKSGSTYTVSCNEKMYNIGVCIYQADKSTVISRANNYNVSAFTINSADSDRYVRFWFDQDGSTTMTIALLNAKQPMFEIGNARTSYSTYSNICPISGWDSVDVQRTGINLFDYRTVRTATINGVTLTNNNDGTLTLNGTATADAFFDVFNTQFTAEPLAERTYTLSGCPKGGGQNSYLLYIRPNYMSDYGNGKTFTQTVVGGSLFVKQGQTLNNLIFRPQIELGSSVSDFKPYQGDTYQIQLGQTVYGGKLNVTGGKMVVDRAMVDMTSITDWNIDRNAQRIYKIRSDMKPNTSGATVPNLLSNRFQVISPNAIYANTQGVSLSVGSALQFHIDGLTDNADVSLAEVNQWFIDNPTQVVYELATPITIDLTPIEISVLTGQTNNIWADCGDVTVELENNVQTATVPHLYAVGNYKDEVDVISGAVTRRVGVKVLDGTENWGAKNATTGQTITRVADMLNQSSAPLIVTHGEWSTSATKDSNKWRVVVGPYLACFPSQETTADFKAWLADQYAAGTPVIVLYPLAEEVTESVTPQRLTTVKGTNTVSTVANVSPVDGSCEYAAVVE